MKLLIKKLLAFCGLLLGCAAMFKFFLYMMTTPHNRVAYKEYFTPDKIGTYYVVMWKDSAGNSYQVQPVDTLMWADTLANGIHIYPTAYFTLSSTIYERWVLSDSAHHFVNLQRGDGFFVTKDGIELFQKINFARKQ